MLSKLYWINSELATMSRPNGHEDLGLEAKHWVKLHVSTVVSLLMREEAKELGLENEEKLCKQHGIDFINFPIKDRHTPESYLQTKSLIDRLTLKVESKEKVLIHCRGGIGRASIIAGAILVKQGHAAQTTLKLISEKRGLGVPDTEEQARWLADFEEKIKHP